MTGGGRGPNASSQQLLPTSRSVRGRALAVLLLALAAPLLYMPVGVANGQVSLVDSLAHPELALAAAVACGVGLLAYGVAILVSPLATPCAGVGGMAFVVMAGAGVCLCLDPLQPVPLGAAVLVFVNALKLVRVVFATRA